MAESCARGNKSMFHEIQGTSRIASQEGLRSMEVSSSARKSVN